MNEKIIGYLLVAFSVALFIILAVIKVQVDKESAFLCEKFHENNINMAACPVHEADSLWANISWMLMTAFGISFLVFGIGIYLIFFYKASAKETKKDFKEIDLLKLDDEEKKIYSILKSKNGSAYQSDLIKETGLSKVKITRVLDKLEAGDILERKRRGMTNIIVLK